MRFICDFILLRNRVLQFFLIGSFFYDFFTRIFIYEIRLNNKNLHDLYKKRKILSVSAVIVIALSWIFPVHVGVIDW